MNALGEFTVTILWLMWRCFRQDTSSQPCVYTFQHFLMPQSSFLPIIFRPCAANFAPQIARAAVRCVDSFRHWVALPPKLRLSHQQELPRLHRYQTLSNLRAQLGHHGRRLPSHKVLHLLRARPIPLLGRRLRHLEIPGHVPRHLHLWRRRLRLDDMLLRDGPLYRVAVLAGGERGW